MNIFLSLCLLLNVKAFRYNLLPDSSFLFPLLPCSLDLIFPLVLLRFVLSLLKVQCLKKGNVISFLLLAA